MAKTNEELWRLALIVDAAPDLFASEDIEDVRRDLQAIGIDPGPTRESVKATVDRWLQVVQAERRRQGRKQSQKASFGSRVRGVIQAFIEPHVFPAVQTAVGPRTRVPGRHLIARVDEFGSLRLERHVRIDIKPASVGCRLILALEPRAYSRSPGRLLKPRRAQIEVEVVRGEEVRAKAAFSGSTMFQEINLPDYEQGEESSWKVNVRIGNPQRRRERGK